MGDDNAAAWAAAGQTASAAINYASAASANRRGREWARQQYERERNDALTDWHMQNEYNSPAAQMARLKAGGLNPNLVYGDGANSPSATIRPAHAEWKPEAPQLDLRGAANSILAATQLRNTEAQTDNLKVQQRLLEQQILKEAATTQSIGSQTSRSDFDLQQIKAKAATDIAQVEANLGKTQAETRKIEADTNFTINQDERNALLNNQSLQKGLEEIANLRTTGDATRQSIKNMQTQNAIAELDRALKARGIQPHHPYYVQLAAKAYDIIKRDYSPKAFKTWVDNTVKQLSTRVGNKVNNYRNSLLPSN